MSGFCMGKQYDCVFFFGSGLTHPPGCDGPSLETERNDSTERVIVQRPLDSGWMDDARAEVLDTQCFPYCKCD